MGLFTNINNKKFKEQRYIFEFYRNPVSIKGWKEFTNLKTKGVRYYASTLQSHCEGIDTNAGMKLLIRVRYPKNKQETLTGLCISGVTGFSKLSANKYDFDIDYLVNKNTVDFVYKWTDRGEDENSKGITYTIIHLVFKDHNNDPVEMYLVYNNLFTSKAFRDYIASLIDY